MAQIKGASNTISTFKSMGSCNYINCRSGKQRGQLYCSQEKNAKNGTRLIRQLSLWMWKTYRMAKNSVGKKKTQRVDISISRYNKWYSCDWCG